MKRKALATLIALAVAVGVMAQTVDWDEMGNPVVPRLRTCDDEPDTARWHFGVSTSTLVSWGGLMPAGGLELRGTEPRSLLPRKHVSTASTLGIDVCYRATDRLMVWGSLEHTYGMVYSMPIDVTAISGGFAYTLGQGNTIEMHIRLETDSYHPMQTYGAGFGYGTSLVPGFGRHALGLYP